MNLNWRFRTRRDDGSKHPETVRSDETNSSASPDGAKATVVRHSGGCARKMTTILQLATLRDLVFLRSVNILIDPAEFDAVLRRENIHLDFTACESCCAITFQPHQPSCPRASLLFEPDWFETLMRWYQKRLCDYRRSQN